MANTNCTLDADCPGKSVCFSATRTSWVKKSFGVNASFCECNRNELHMGFPDCNIPAPSYYAEIGFRAFELALIFLALFICCWDLVRLKRIGQFTWMKPTVQTTLWLVLANISHAVTLAVVMNCFDPTLPNVLAVGFKLCGRATALLVFTVFAILFSFLAQANVAVVWVNLVAASKTVKRVRDDRLKRALYGLMIVYFIILSAATGTLNLNAALVVSIPFSLVLIIGYSIGGKSLESVLMQSIILSAGHIDPNRGALHRSLQRVQHVSRLMVLLLSAEVISLILTGIFIAESGGAQYEMDFWNRPGATCFILDQFIMICLNLVVAVYIHKSITSTVQASTRATSDEDPGDSKQLTPVPNNPPAIAAVVAAQPVAS